jgi:hypothetical protein
VLHVECPGCPRRPEKPDVGADVEHSVNGEKTGAKARFFIAVIVSIPR